MEGGCEGVDAASACTASKQVERKSQGECTQMQRVGQDMHAVSACVESTQVESEGKRAGAACKCIECIQVGVLRPGYGCSVCMR